MISFKEWREKGLADPGFKNRGTATPKNKILYDKYKIPAVPTYRFSQDNYTATKLDPGK